MKIHLLFKFHNQRLYDLINSFDIKHDENSSISLIINSNSLELYNRQYPKQKPIKVDFTSNKNNYRCYSVRKKNEILSKAVGIKNSYYPFVLDATAGLGNDAFILSFLGCKVVMIERHPIIAALLKDGLQRAYEDKKIGNWLKKRLHLIFNDSCDMLKIPFLKPDVIYLDPMYPIRKKMSLPKKNMQIFRKLIGQDYDSKNLLKISRKLAKKRIVVKRPCYAKPLSKDKINFVIMGKKHRFDIYSPL
ncbi:MAG: class I SAM-dependent methyltransferase [Buchnera aphidicola (Brevicoryne brassicae)]|uniref:Ribosomal RNA small subunit methyltransferase J n=1 Tax=Buchnera aphidicola (Brevicoryne brassicae) TaxID=911343 RepID=A0AAJ5PU48_9GAMM|nr:class I SAM-dependent methyltransferase [Buchnera aphidicola]QCI20120.1 16S rRNA methyltransferase [Buchnera aphidicola (Brevicoryne brassicae)]WAI18944.1 MAG: class I SAM-dependent methyltransferase [Buchnera aphidicola (Brevicoryne brassicae)]